MAEFTLKHDYISLNKIGSDGQPLGPGRARAGVRYITRKAAEYVHYIGFTPNTHAARREMQAIEDAMPRKDARITHTFIIALPRECNQEQRKDLCKRIAWAMTDKGKSPGIFAVHTDKEQNPHLHGTVPDRQVTFHRERGRVIAEVGPSVLKLTAKPVERQRAGMHGNATQSLRLMWRDVCNNAMEDYGLEARIDNRTRLQRALDHQPGTAKVNLPQTQSEIIVTPDELSDHVGKLLDESVKDERKVTKQDLVEGALMLNHNLKWIEATQNRIKELEGATREALDRGQEAKEQASYHDKQAGIHRNLSDLVQDNLKPLLKEDGTPKGLHVKLWKLEWKSPTFQEAEWLMGELQYQEYLKKEQKELADRHLDEAQRQADLAQSYLDTAKAKQRELEESVSFYGDDATLEDTKQVLNEGIQENLKDLTADEICAMHENGVLTAEQAYDTLTLMGQEAYHTRIELRDRQEIEQEELEL